MHRNGSLGTNSASHRYEMTKVLQYGNNLTVVPMPQPLVDDLHHISMLYTVLPHNFPKVFNNSNACQPGWKMKKATI